MAGGPYWPACHAVGVNSTLVSPASHRVPPPAWPRAAFFSLLAASFFLRETLWFSAHTSQRVWFGMACPRQCRQVPSSLALSRRSLAAFLAASLYSGGRCLGPLCSLCVSGVFLTFCGEAFLGALGFGFHLALVLPGFVNRRRSPGFSRVRVDEGLFAGSYLPLNLLGNGTRRAKVAPTARLGGVSVCATGSHGQAVGSSPHLRGIRCHLCRPSETVFVIPAPARYPFVPLGFERMDEGHPRTCGVSPVSEAPPDIAAESSPHLRGIPASAPFGKARRRVIPAPAGYPARWRGF